MNGLAVESKGYWRAVDKFDVKLCFHGFSLAEKEFREVAKESDETGKSHQAPKRFDISR